MADWTYKLPNRYFICPDGTVRTSPQVPARLLDCELVRQLLGPVLDDTRELVA